MIRGFLDGQSESVRTLYNEFYACLYNGEAQTPAMASLLSQASASRRLGTSFKQCKGSYIFSALVSDTLIRRFSSSAQDIEKFNQEHFDDFLGLNDGQDIEGDILSEEKEERDRQEAKDSTQEQGEAQGSAQEQGEAQGSAQEQGEAQEPWSAPFCASMNILNDEATQKVIESGLVRLKGLAAGLGKGADEFFLSKEFLAVRNTRFIEILSDYLGRGIASRKKSKTAKEWQDGGVVPYDVETGDNLSRLLGESYALLASEETEDLFFIAYAEQDLLQYQVKERVRKEQGNFVGFIDVSGSMMANNRIDRAMAIAASLAIASLERGGNVELYLFESGFTHIDMPKGTSISDALRLICGRTAGGGTNLEPALSHYIEKSEKDSVQDVLIITDGYLTITEESADRFLELMRGKADVLTLGMGVDRHALCSNVERISGTFISSDSVSEDIKQLA